MARERFVFAEPYPSPPRFNQNAAIKAEAPLQCAAVRIQATWRGKWRLWIYRVQREAALLLHVRKGRLQVENSQTRQPAQLIMFPEVEGWKMLERRWHQAQECFGFVTSIVRTVVLCILTFVSCGWSSPHVPGLLFYDNVWPHHECPCGTSEILKKRASECPWMGMCSSSDTTCPETFCGRKQAPGTTFEC